MEILKSFFTLITICFVTSLAENLANYTENRLIQITFKYDSEYNILDVFRIESGSNNISVWVLNKDQKFGHVMVTSEAKGELNKICYSQPNRCDNLIQDVQDAIEGNPKGYTRDVFVNYEGYKLYQLKYETEEQLEDLNWWRITSGTGDFAFWLINVDKKFAHVMVSPLKLELFEDFVKDKKYSFEVIVENVQKLIPKF